MSRNLYYYKIILRKVSFNSVLFRKELNKAYENLSYEDTLLLNNGLMNGRKMELVFY